MATPPLAPHFDLLGIGNAIVDVVAAVPEEFLDRHRMTKGAMTLIDAATAENLYREMPAGQESSGGSAANTCAVAAALGARAAFLGVVADDALGATFRRDITAAGVHFPTPPLPGGEATARCLIAVTEDGQRTMNTYLGASTAFTPEAVDEALVAAAAVTYLEGYLFDPPQAQAAFRYAARVARAAGRKVALSLSDSFCVHRHRAAFRDLLASSIDILFANEAEICALYETTDVTAAAALAGQQTGLAVVTQGEHGSLIAAGDALLCVPAAPARPVDTTGAGDAFAAGFLAAYTAGRALPACGELGSLAAAEVISHFGARPQRDLKSTWLRPDSI
jgi:fructokinase